MSEDKHTPGPWRAVRSNPAEGADVWWIVAGAGPAEREVGSMCGGYPQALREANARLAAAAPDLLEALVAYDKYMLDAGYEGPEALHPNAAENWRRIRAAITKATGVAT